MNNGTRPTLIARYATTADIVGAAINGININGFITIGNPNSIGSFILNIPGPTASLPKALFCSDFAIVSINITKPIVKPDPVTVTKLAPN
ncbi:hypothetical protein D3C73_1465820 [compost metagenome]